MQSKRKKIHIPVSYRYAATLRHLHFERGHFFGSASSTPITVPENLATDDETNINTAPFPFDNYTSFHLSFFLVMSKFKSIKKWDGFKEKHTFVQGPLQLRISF